MPQEMLACAIGARSQMSRTYLERHLAKLADCGRKELIKHGLLALKESLARNKELMVENTRLGAIGIASKDGKRRLEPFKLYDGQEIAPLLEANLKSTATADGKATVDAMETDQ